MCSTHWETMWSFKTARFVVSWEVTPDPDCDLSFDDTGEVRENIESGLWECFGSRVRVTLDGVTIGQDDLWGSIYEHPKDFRDHFGMNTKGHGSYFSDMVREAVGHARVYLAGVPTLRTVEA